MNIIARFEVPYYQFINEKSETVQDLPEFAKDSQNLLKLYRLMVLNRVFDTKAIALQRTGKMGTYPSTRGQEATFVGVGNAMAQNDVLVPYYRDVGILTQRGVKFSEILLYWGGDERGNCFMSDREDFPYSVPVGSQPLHAVGVATAFSIRKEKRAAVSVCGEGASSQGDFYEAMNVAGIWKLPVVFIVNNNQWAISVSREAQTASQTIAQKAIAAGFTGEVIDGNDVVAVRARTEAALQRAREQHEPTLLEMVNYRQHDHTTADDASRYENKAIREKEWVKEPLTRLRNYLEKNNLWDTKKEEALQTECSTEVEKIVEEYLNIPPQPLESMMDYLYEKLPDIYLSQREQLKTIKVGENTHG